MASALRLASLALLGVEGGRVARRKGQRDAPDTKFIADVPVLNYHLAFADQPSMVETKDVVQDWNVVVAADTQDEQIQNLCRMADCRAEGHPAHGGVPFFQIRATEEELETVLRSASGIAKFVEPDSEVRLIPTLQAEPERSMWGLNHIGAHRRSSSGVGSHIYVLDTGIRKTHVEFGDRVIPTLDETRWINKECLSWSPLSCAGDKQGHGTHCAGTAGGSSYGVAPGATLHAVKVLKDDGTGQFSWSYNALDYVATKGERPAVASMSLGGRGTQSAMKEAIDAAVANGVTVVVAAGNENSNACNYSPAFVPAAITVGSTTSMDFKSYFSNFGSCTNIWAPGSGIKSAHSDSDTASATFDGTSMACPHVSGAVALLQEKDPGLSSAKAMSRIMSSASKGWLLGLKSGDTNAFLQVKGF